MLEGNFELAWRESDAIAQRGKPDPHRFWDGTLLNSKRVLLRCLHGLGDTLQFIRYAPLIRKVASRLIVETQPSLKSLIADSRLADEVITWGEPEPVWDQQIEVMELTRIFRTTLATIPNDVPYLRLRRSGTSQVVRSRRLRAGLVWTSSAYNVARSVSFKDLKPLMLLSGLELFSFQAGETRAQIHGCPFDIIDLCDETDLVAVAQRVSEMDLMITVDTMMAHLAGALSKKVWTLLPFESDWRWMMGRSDSPWYPTMRLFRQRVPGDWGPVISEIRTELLREINDFELRAR